MFARVPSVLFSDALGHEIVPLSTLASPKPKTIAHPQPGELPFCMCVFVRHCCLFAFSHLCECLFEWLLVSVCVCEGVERAEDGWVLGVSWPSPFLSD